MFEFKITMDMDGNVILENVGLEDISQTTGMIMIMGAMRIVREKGVIESEEGIKNGVYLN